MSRCAPLVALLILGAPLLPSAAMAGSLPPVAIDDTRTAKAIDALFRASYPADGPGATIVVTRAGRTIFAGARGMADIRAGRALAVDDPFPLASITKALTAALVVKLADEGKLSLDDKLSSYVPAMAAANGQATIRQLLNHNSGIADFSKVPGFIAANRDKTFSTAALVDVTAKLPPTAAPGEKWEYNNGGYVLLGAVIEKVTGLPWHQAMREKLFAPLGFQSLAATGLPTNMARPYGGPGADAEAYAVGEISIAGASGQMIGNASDLARFFNALHGGTLVSADGYRQMTARAPMKDGSTMPYGFGFRIGRLLDRPTYYQGGSLRGGRTETLYLPEQKLFVAILANSDEPQSQPRELAQRVAAAALGTPLPTFTKAAMSMERVRPMLGRYKGDEGPDRLLFEQDGTLWFAFGNSPAREAFSAGGDRYFFGHDELMWFELAARDGKRHLVMHVAEDTKAHDAVFAAAPAKPAAIADTSGAGRYKPEAGAEFVITVGPGGVMTVSSGGRTIGTLRAIEAGQYAIDGTPMRLEFVREGNRVTGLKMFRGARTMNAVRID